MLSRPSPLTDAVAALMTQACGRLVATQDEWLPPLTADALTAVGLEAAANDPALRAAAERAFHATFLDWFGHTMVHPGEPVPVRLNDAVRQISRELVLLGLEDVAISAYSAGQARAFALLIDAAFSVTDDPAELQILLETATWSMSSFVERTVAAVDDLMATEREDVARAGRAEVRQAVELVLSGAEITAGRAESRLGYRLDSSHVAIIAWTEQGEAGVSELETATRTIVHGGRRALAVAPSSSTRWLWTPGTELQAVVERVQATARQHAPVRFALGGPHSGIAGFRRSHREALRAQRFASGPASGERAVTVFDDVHLLSIMLSDQDEARDFVERVLGPFAGADASVIQTVAIFVESGCSVRETAARAFCHRNTVLRRLALARRDLPRPLEDNAVQVGVALRLVGHLERRAAAPGSS
ncbi:DNA-binding PucR family transcriptional regulator [Aeromicrobium sp. SORGH_AS981]|uniref:PucR family transcriptional regulator n=1 Tax=Aeromicrobium sp. SORGH_AS_0981 TaxID=3041802 RepID=UPI0028608A72|nr:helix-turn-helix domain-containing protein [Aeromicrobium sp. SORGH_AS_0981]MDR6117339.1 DNA-binding PucR family transcriptional regulator [Aeromicrobium sp. SORGH_AS_0981]